MFYSATMNAFYLPEKEADYRAQDVWPSDAVPVSDAMASEFIASPPAGQQRIAGEDGLPCWADIPPLTQAELQALANDEKQRRIATANGYINSQQWPSKLTLGRLSALETANFNEWLDYLDAVGAVDIVTAPDIVWPTPPAQAAK